MNTEKKKYDDLDVLINTAMHAEPDARLTAGFTDLFIRKIQRRIVWRELLTDFSFKMGIVLLVLGVFAAIYFFVMVKDPAVLVSFISGSWKIIAAVSVVVLFTFLTDQVFLKYLFRNRQEQ